MNESTVSSDFQTRLRKFIPGCEVIKHADKSMIGMVDASATFNKKTLWMEYKFIGPNTKGVTAEFMKSGAWSAHDVAMSSPTQYATARRLATSGHCVYLFWVLDHLTIRKKVGRVVMWNPIHDVALFMEDTPEAVFRVSQFFDPNQSRIPVVINEFFTLL